MAEMKHKFFVACKGERGVAACLDDRHLVKGRALRLAESLVKEFFRDYAGHEIRHVSPDEMVRLMQFEHAR